MVEIFQALLYQPIFNLFVALYNFVGDIGIVIFLLTILIKLVLWPLTRASIQAQKSLQEVQPKMDALKEKYKDNQQELAQATMQLYKEHKVNPVGSCLPLLIQIPIFLALYWVLRNGFSSPDTFDALYSFVPSPGSINPISLGLIDLSQSNILLALAAGAAQFFQAKSMSRRRPPKAAGKGGKDEDMMALMNKQMLYFMPVLTVIISMSLPGGVALYWFLSTLTTAIQQQIMFAKDGSDDSGKKDAIEGKIVS